MARSKQRAHPHPPCAQVGIEDAIHTALLTLKEGFEGQVSGSNIEVRARLQRWRGGCRGLRRPCLQQPCVAVRRATGARRSGSAPLVLAAAGRAPREPESFKPAAAASSHGLAAPRSLGPVPARTPRARPQHSSRLPPPADAPSRPLLTCRPTTPSSYCLLLPPGGHHRAGQEVQGAHRGRGAGLPAGGRVTRRWRGGDAPRRPRRRAPAGPRRRCLGGRRRRAGRSRRGRNCKTRTRASELSQQPLVWSGLPARFRALQKEFTPACAPGAGTTAGCGCGPVHLGRS